MLSFCLWLLSHWCAWPASLLHWYDIRSKEKDLEFKHAFHRRYQVCHQAYSTNTHGCMVTTAGAENVPGTKLFFFSLVSPHVPRFPWVDVCGGQCVYLCACLRSEMMCEQEPCDRFAGCQSLEAFPLGCVQNKINIQYLAALVTETWAPHTH